MHQFGLVIERIQMSLNPQQSPGEPEESFSREPEHNIPFLLFPRPLLALFGVNRRWWVKMRKYPVIVRIRLDYAQTVALRLRAVPCPYTKPVLLIEIEPEMTADCVAVN